jgi:hypothetical protein
VLQQAKGMQGRQLTEE